MRKVGRNTTSAGIDLWRRFTPFDTQARFLRSPAKYRLLSSGYGGGKSALGCRESIRHAVQYPGSRNGIFRDVGEQLRKTTMVTFWREMGICGFKEGVHYTYLKQEKEVRWWNGSVTLFSHFEDVDALGSFELSTAFIDEGADVPDEIYAALFPGRLRAHLPGCQLAEEIQARVDAFLPHDDLKCACPQRGWVCTNPGASGYLKAVTLGQMGAEWEWFPVKPGENPFNGPDYYAEMKRKRAINGEVWFKRYFEGDWSAFEGQRFTMFDRERHVLPTTFTPTPDYEIVEGWDFGHRETFVAWIAYKPDSNEPVVVFDELQYREVQQPSQVANAVKEIRARHKIADRVRALGDPTGANASQFSDVGPITAYAQLGIYIAPCRIGKSPTGRADVLAKFMVENRKQIDGQIWPGIVFAPNCTALIDSITNLRWKPNNSRLGEEGREQFVKVNDHGFDALGYGILGVPPPGEPKIERQPAAGVNRHPKPDDVLAPDNSGWVEA